MFRLLQVSARHLTILLVGEEGARKRARTSHVVACLSAMLFVGTGRVKYVRTRLSRASRHQSRGAPLFRFHGEH